jgi:hypothetical protein
MSPSPASTPPIQTPGQWNVGAYNTGNARQLTQQELDQIAQQGANLQGQDYNTYAQQMGLSSGTQDYLGNLESPLAQGQGGYNSSEQSQIQMTPEQQAQMVSASGISAGTATQAAADAAQRASAAAGGSPAAEAAYRARAAQQSGAQAGQAQTQAGVAASNAAAQRTEDIGQTRIGQQNQALGYYGGLQSQQNANAQNALGLQEQAYGTQTGGTTAAGNTAEAASQTPTTADKVMGADAVIGENGPEKVVQIDGYRAQPRRMEDGAAPSQQPQSQPVAPDARAQQIRSIATYGAPRMAYGGIAPRMDDGSVPEVTDVMGSGDRTEYGGSAMPQAPSMTDRLKALIAQGQQRAQPGQQQPGQPPQGAPTQSSDIDKFGSGIGRLAGAFLDSGGIIPPGAHPSFTGSRFQEQEQTRNGVFTSPTHVKLDPGEAVVPLGYRAQAKTRPSMANLPAAKVRRPYGAAA